MKNSLSLIFIDPPTYLWNIRAECPLQILQYIFRKSTLIVLYISLKISFRNPLWLSLIDPPKCLQKSTMNIFLVPPKCLQKIHNEYFLWILQKCLWKIQFVCPFNNLQNFFGNPTLIVPYRSYKISLKKSTLSLLYRFSKISLKNLRSLSLIEPPKYL